MPRGELIRDSESIPASNLERLGENLGQTRLYAASGLDDFVLWVLTHMRILKPSSVRKLISRLMKRLSLHNVFSNVSSSVI